ncbi:MAG: NADP-dependent oxidoreductase [Myxococcota bacterium]
MATDTTNRKVVLARRPDGALAEGCFRIEEEALRPLDDGEIRVATHALSIDAFMRTILYEQSFHASVPIGGTLTALGVGRVVESRDPGFAEGDAVTGPLMAQTHAVLPGRMLHKVDAERAPLSAWLGVLGMTTGLTAYFGVCRVGAVAEGETVLVSAAAGAVGSVASQIAKLRGARVIGLAGGPAKVRYLTDELGLDAGIDYKGEDVGARLDALAPDGIDVYFDNVGGELLDLALDRIRLRGRVVLCGAISQYDDMQDVRGPRLYLRLAERQARMEGFAVDHFRDRFGEAVEQLADWYASGRLSLREHVEHGIERLPAALCLLMAGGNMGKMLVAIDDA